MGMIGGDMAPILVIYCHEWLNPMILLVGFAFFVITSVY